MDTSTDGTGCGCTIAIAFMLGVIWLIIYAFNGMNHPVKIVGLIFIIIVAISLLINIIQVIASLFE